MNKIIFWFGVAVMSLLVMVQPVRASGLVAPTSPAYVMAAAPTAWYGATPAAVCSKNVDMCGGCSGVLVGSACVIPVSCSYEPCRNLSWEVIANPNFSCPVNSTGTVTCTCNSGFVPDANATACVVGTSACPAVGGIVSSGFFDVGIDPNLNNGAPPLLTCSNGCYASYSGGSISKRAQIGGVYHYYAQGSYSYSSFGGQECTSGPSIPSSSALVPAATCGTGQSMVLGAGGFVKCYTDAGVLVDGNSASAVSSAQTISDAQTASKLTAAASAVAAAGGSASDVAAAQSVAAGVAAAGGSSGSASGITDPVLKSFCEQNPDSSICVNTEMGEPPAPETLASSSPAFSVSSVAFSSVAGCPAPQTFAITGLPFISKSYSISWQPFCDMAGILRPIFLALAAITAAFIFAGVTI